VYGFSALPQDLTLADVLGVPFDLLLDEPSSAEFIEALRQSEAGELPRSTHLWRLRPRERQGPARWLAVTLLDRRRHPSIRALVLHVCDANALRPAQEPFARLERRAQVFADCSADVLMLVDTGGVVRDQSPAINRTLDLAPGQSLGRPAAELWLAADHGRWVTTVQAAAADTSPRAHHCLVRAPARGVTLRLWLAVHNYTNEPAIGGLLVSGRDITQALQDAAAATATHERRLAFRDRLLELAMQTRGPLPQVLAGVLRTDGRAGPAGGQRQLLARCRVRADAAVRGLVRRRERPLQPRLGRRGAGRWRPGGSAAGARPPSRVRRRHCGARAGTPLR
jgi:PAS domain-containing protein